MHYRELGFMGKKRNKFYVEISIWVKKKNNHNLKLMFSNQSKGPMVLIRTYSRKNK